MTEFWVIQQNRKYLLEFHFGLGDPPEYNFRPGELPEYYIRTGTETSRLLQLDQSRLPTSGLYRLHQPDTVTIPKGKSPPTFYTLPGTGSLTSSIARYPLVQPDLYTPRHG